ncbi:DUF1918 domain-containing protein [Streptomyces sp. NPDC001093]|uniref:DUF1918 domain-containing protein n=1 Tax=Streptomyces sp. NPDC001093 TaxID=3154376 RepID=UPI003324D5A3
MTTPERGQRTDRVAPPARPGESAAPMRARVGDEIVVRGTTAGAVTRDGEVVGVHHPAAAHGLSAAAGPETGGDHVLAE